jgi:hypothetical protein
MGDLLAGFDPVEQSAKFISPRKFIFTAKPPISRRSPAEAVRRKAADFSDKIIS